MTNQKEEQIVYVPCVFDDATHFITSGITETIQAVKPVSMSSIIEEKVKEKDLIIYGLEEGSSMWKSDCEKMKSILERLNDWHSKHYDGKNYSYYTASSIEKEFEDIINQSLLALKHSTTLKQAK